ncbi:hypothetical protein CG709_12600 [Lachnotalea glycerini]|nr:hypothetical protein CG709_12600 [Lachnotalea glycerini]
MARLKVEDSKVIEIYNTQGKAAAIETIHATYGVKDAYYVLRRLKATESYAYDSKRDLFCKKVEMPFLALDELCIESRKNSIDKDVDCRPTVQIESKFDSYVQAVV